eukprot:GHVR01193052.1.p1 GENE.GHVR01193052.1~~GHVR01193052.1.p1  ORF type:complete len:405 (+),score=80.60 GHVR01193052.1:1360-2574(+)
MNATKKEKWDQDFEPLMKFLLCKDRLKTKSAIEVGKRAVTYFRGPDLCELVNTHADTIRKKFPNTVKDLDLSLPSDVDKLGCLLITKKFIIKAMYKPLDDSTADDKSQRRPKWPKRLIACPTQRFEPHQFYIVSYDEGDKTMSRVLLGGIIGGVLVCVMFPAWPFWAKVWVWYLSVIVLSLFMYVCVLRLFVFVLLWFCGMDFWIFPNMFDEYLGFIDSFRPLYAYEWRMDDWKMVAVRVFCAIVTAGGVYQLSQTHSISDVTDFASNSFFDIIQWGENKLMQLPDSESSFPSLEHIMKDSEVDESITETKPLSFECLSKCKDVKDYDVIASNIFMLEDIKDMDTLKEECISDCPCAQKLTTMHCFKTCDSVLKEMIETYRDEICSAQNTSENISENKNIRDEI